MEHLRSFEQEQEYNLEKSGFTYPTVSTVEETGDVLYMDTEEYLFNYYASRPLTLIPVDGDSRFWFDTQVQYSLDEGNTWTGLPVETRTPYVEVGGKLMLRGTNQNFSGVYSDYGFNAEGNIFSVIDATNFKNITVATYNCLSSAFSFSKIMSAENMVFPPTTVSQDSYRSFFYGCEYLRIPPKVLPATTLAVSCYAGMFKECSSLIKAPKLPATTLGDYCYQEMFSTCNLLVDAPELPATTLAECCYSHMFEFCGSLTKAPELPATTLGDWCYENMFSDCSIVDAPSLPATTLVDGCYWGMFQTCPIINAPSLPATALTSECYSHMFYGCGVLETTPELPATTLAELCYASMFENCKSLTTGPVLPATTLAEGCYNGMFANCKELTTAPVLSATTLSKSCYYNMFKNCSKLNYIKMLATDITAENCLKDWTSGVARSGTFVQNGSADWYVLGPNGIPIGWKLEYEGESSTAEQAKRDYEQDLIDGYLKFEAIEDGSFTLTIPSGVSTTAYTSITYTTNSGESWVRVYNKDSKAVNVKTPVVSAGTEVWWYGSGKRLSISTAAAGISKFSSTGKFNIKGKLNSLLTENASDSAVSDNSNYYYTFAYLFSGCTNVVNASGLTFGTVVTQYGHYNMFNGCTSLASAPSMPATRLTVRSYSSMFSGCTSLTTAPELPATTIGNYCYSDMFRSCSGLTAAPDLPAKTLASYCYQNMFSGCTSLTTVNGFSGTTLATYCCDSMFRGCSGLTTAPELPATTLASNCYRYMFYNCKALTTAPVLQARTLVTNCYYYMFYGCSNLNYIKAMFTTTPSTSYTYGWVTGVSSTGTFVKNSAATWTTTGANGVPSNWTVETASS